MSIGNRVSLEKKLSENILTITLKDAEASAHLSTAWMDALREIMQEVYDNDEIRSVIITGVGERTFSTGIPPVEIQALNELNGRKFVEHGQETFALIEDCHKPILAAINGKAHGGGLSLALACHFRVAVEKRYPLLPRSRYGSYSLFWGHTTSRSFSR